MKLYYKNKSLIILFFLLTINQISYGQKHQISGRIIDGDTKQHIDSAIIYIFGRGYSKFNHINSDSLGYYKFDGLNKGKYNFHLLHDNYKTGYKMIVVSDSSVVKNLEMYHVDSSGMSKIDDIAFEDKYHGGFAVNFYNPKISSEFKSSFNIEYFFSYKTRISNFDQLGIEITPLKLVWHKLNNDTVITNEKYKNEKYFGYYISASLYNRLIVSKQRRTGSLGFFVDLGIGYELPVTYRYTYNIDSDNKHITKNIHSMNELTGVARIGFDVISIKLTYRFTNIMKSNYPEPPKLKIGIELNFPSREI